MICVSWLKPNASMLSRTFFNKSSVVKPVERFTETKNIKGDIFYQNCNPHTPSTHHPHPPTPTHIPPTHHLPTTYAPPTHYPRTTHTPPTHISVHTPHTYISHIHTSPTHIPLINPYHPPLPHSPSSVFSLSTSCSCR